MYAVSYRWWDTWKEYTERHTTAIEVKLQQEKIMKNLEHDPSISEDLRKYLLGLDYENKLELDEE